MRGLLWFTLGEALLGVLDLSPPPVDLNRWVLKDFRAAVAPPTAKTSPWGGSYHSLGAHLS